MYFGIFLKKIEWWFIQLLELKKFGNVGKGTKICFGIFSDEGNIYIGDYVYIGEGSIFHAAGGIKIGSGTIIGPNVLIRSSNHPYKNQNYIPYGFGIEKKEVQIGENCWIGEGVIIVPGANIGEGSIIGMGSVVAGNIPPMSIVVGNPGKVIKHRDEEMYMKSKKEGNIYLKHKFIRK